MDQHAPSPELSLAIAAKGKCDPAPFWAALKAGGFDKSAKVEVILGYSDIGTLAGVPDNIVQIRQPADASVFDLGGTAIAEARAPYVAILDIHCPPSPGWLDAVLRAIENGGSGYFGPVEALCGAGDKRIIGYLTEYVQFHRPIAPALAEIPGNNLVVRRDLLEDSARLTRQGFSKTSLINDWAVTQPAPPVLVNDAVVFHQKPFALAAYCVRRYRHGRCFAAARASRFRRLAYVPITPLLPFLRVWRIIRHTMRVPALRGSLLRFLIPIALAETAWSWGELSGYLMGEGGCRPLLD